MIDLVVVLLALGRMIYLAFRGITLILLAPGGALLAVAPIWLDWRTYVEPLWAVSRAAKMTEVIQTDASSGIFFLRSVASPACSSSFSLGAAVSHPE